MAEGKGQSLEGAFILINSAISYICYSEVVQILVQNAFSLVPSTRFSPAVCS